jgi:hypothetical protein
MSDGITLYCPRCGKLTALKKEYDKLRVIIPADEEAPAYETSIPVYTCPCGARCAIEFVYKKINNLKREVGGI